MSVYKLNKRLQPNYLTDINPEEFYDSDSLIARKAYTAVDQSLSDSLKEVRAKNGYVNYLTFELPQEYGNHLLKLNRKHPEYFKDADSFIDNVLKGIYAKCDYGDGTVLYIDQVELIVRYRGYIRDNEGKFIKSPDGVTDSIFGLARSFASTKEVIQVNNFENSDELATVADDPDATYIKSPAGIFTKVKLPIQQIYDEREKDSLNSVRLTFTGYVQHDKDDIYAMSPPANIVMLREKDKNTFFETNSLTDETKGTSYRASYVNNQYAFTNITNLINYCIAEKEAVRKEEGKDWTEAEWKAWEEENMWDSVVLVPVIVNSISGTPMSIHNDLRPGYVKLKGGVNNPFDIKVEYTKFY